MRPVRALVAILVLAACKGGGGDARFDGSQISNSAGEVSLSDGGSLQYSITSDRYKQWDAARRGLDRRMASRFGALLQPASPSERSIAKAVQYLEGELRAKQAIERAGMSVRDFVVMTVALEQEMRLASSRGSPEPMPMPAPYPPPLDSTSMSARADSLPRIDTAFVPPKPLPPPRFLPTDTMPSLPPRRDTIVTPRDTLAPRRDTVVPRRDTVVPRRDTIAQPKPAPPRDTLRDTTKIRDTLSIPRASHSHE
jgi:hypothetical protein